MPMWLYKRKPDPPKPRPTPTTAEKAAARAAAAAGLSDSLMDAIITGDMAAARQVFDRAFWDKVDFRPDSYHLLQAVKRDNRDMVKLLTTHGAQWTPEEFKMARLIAGPDRVGNVEGVLRQAGMRTQFTTDELLDINPLAAVQWARRSVEEAERRHAPDAAQARRDFDRVIATGVSLHLQAGQAEQAIQLLLSRGGDKGDGSAVRPLDVTNEIHELAVQPRGPERVLQLLDALKTKGLRIKPLVLSGTALWTAPELLKELDARGLLSAAQGESRMNMLHNWSVLQPKIDTGSGGIFELDPALVEAQHKALRRAAEVLFRDNRPASEAEAERFVAIHEVRAKQTPQALARMEKELLDLGFFSSPSFTVQQLKHLAETAPKTGNAEADGSLATSFNRLASARMLSETRTEKFLSPSNFHEILTAHRLRAYKATAADTAKILDYLAGQVKKDAVPEDIVVALKTLRDGGADFSRVNPNRYLGKKAPGLCKALLDLGIVKTQSIDIELIAQRHGGELRPLTPKNTPDHADQEFMCQLVLETVAPEKYIPLRGQSGVDYQRDFIREYTINKLLKRHLRQPRRTP